jgi:hypothetical protein
VIVAAMVMGVPSAHAWLWRARVAADLWMDGAAPGIYDALAVSEEPKCVAWTKTSRTLPSSTGSLDLYRTTYVLLMALPIKAMI